MSVFKPFTCLLPDGVHTRFDCQTLVMQEQSPDKKVIMQSVFGALPEGDDDHYAVVIKRNQCAETLTLAQWEALQSGPETVADDDGEPVEVVQPKPHWKTLQKAAKQAQG